MVCLLNSKIGKSSFESWFDQAELEESTDRITLLFPSSFVHNWVSAHYRDTINLILSNLYGNRQVRLDVTCKSSQILAAQAVPKHILDHNYAGLNRNMNFGTFVVGPSNATAHQGAQVMLKSRNFNSIYISGPSGNGKTHLAQAIAWEMKQKQICYIPAERYMVKFIESIHSKNTLAFKQTFATTDLLILDDFQFIEGKKTTKEELSYTMRELIANNKKVVICSDRDLEELNLDPHLKSRLAAGLRVKIEPPCQKLRLNILQVKAKEYNHNVADHILDHIATQVFNNVRELEGILMKICAHADFTQDKITEQLASDIIHDTYRSNMHCISIDKIIEVISEYYNLTKQSLLEPSSRKSSFVIARQLAIFLCRKLTRKSLPFIANIFGYKNHTTILYSIRQIEDKLKQDQKLSGNLKELEAKLR